MGRRSWRYILILLTFVSFGDAFGQVQLRQMVPADTLTTGDSIADYSHYFIVTNDTVTKPGEFRQRYNYLPEWIGIDTFFTKTDSVCLVLNFPRTDTVCTKIDTLNVIYGDPSDTSYYFQLQVNGGLIDSMTHMELWQINQGANITLNYDGTALTVSADSCLQRLEQLTDSTFRITDCDGNPLDTMLLPGGGGGGTDDQQITQFEISNDTIYLTLEDGGGQKFLVVQHPDTCFHSAEAITDSSFQILDCNGVPLDTVTLRFPGGGTDTHFANTNLSATANRSHNWKNYQFFLDSASYYGIRQSTVNGSALFQLDGFGTFQLTSNSTFPSLFQTYGRTDFKSTNSSIFFDVAQSLWFISDDTNYVFDPTPSLGTDEYVLTVAAPGTTSNIGVREISDFEVAPDSLEYRGDSIAIIGSNALNIYDLIDTSSFGDTDTRIDSLRQIKDGVLDSVWLYRNDLSDSLLMVFSDSVGMDPDWYLIDDTVPPGTIDESIWTNGRVRIGQDSLENAFTLMVNGGVAPFEMVSSAPTNIMRQRHRAQNTAWDHSYQAGVYSIISQNLNTAESGYYISMPEGYVGDATSPLVKIDSSDIGFWKYPSSRNDVTSVDSISALYYPAYDGEIRIAPIDSVLKRLDRDSTTHRDFDFLLLAEGDTLGTNLDSLIPDDSLDLYNLIWHGGQVRLHNTEWDQRYDTLAFGPTDSTTALQIMGERDAIDIYHNFYPYIWMRNAKADAHWRLHNNDNTVDSFPAYMELGFTSWYDSTGTAYLRDTSSRWPLRISSQSNHRAFVLERDSLILGDYKSSDVDTSLTVADLAGSAFYMPSATGKVQLVSPDTVNAFLNVVSSNPDIAFWGFKQDSFGINFLGDIDSIFADFSHLNNASIYIGSDTLYLGDTFALLPQGADSSGVVIPTGQVYFGNNTRAPEGSDSLFWDATNGRIGIGTNSPAANVHIYDSGNNYMRFEGSGDYTEFRQIATQLRINNNVASGNAGIDFNASPLNGSSSAFFRFFRETNTTGAAYFDVFEGDGSSGTNARIAGKGLNSFINAHHTDLHFGVGTSSPNATLHVDGTVRLDNLAADGVSGVLYYDAENDIGKRSLANLQSDLGVLWTDGGTTSYLTSTSDRVHIGGTSAARKLQVTQNTTSNVGLIRLENTSTGDATLELGAGGIYGAIGMDNSGDLIIAHHDNVDASRAIFVDASANVGIAISPSYRLDVNGTFHASGAWYDSSGDAGSSGQVLSSTGSTSNWVDVVDNSITNEIQTFAFSAPATTTWQATLSDGGGTMQIVEGNGIDVQPSGGTATIEHGNTSSQASVNNSGSTFIQDITLDAFGHITAITSAVASGGSSEWTNRTSYLTPNVAGVVAGATGAVGMDGADLRVYASSPILQLYNSSGSNSTVEGKNTGGLLGDINFFDQGTGGGISLRSAYNSTSVATGLQVQNDGDVLLAHDGGLANDQMLIVSTNNSDVRLGHEDHIANYYSRYNDDGTINIVGNGQISISPGSSGNLVMEGNINLGPLNSAGSRVIKITNGTAPIGNVLNSIQLYAEDVASSSELKVRDEASNITTLSPHNFSKIPEGPSEEMAWAFYSERDGKYINVDMLKLVRLVEELTGEKLVYTNSK